MTPPPMKNVFSSHVSSIGYDADAQELHVRFKDGKGVSYLGVSPKKAQDVMSAPSIGTALHQFVKKQHGFRPI